MLLHISVTMTYHLAQPDPVLLIIEPAQTADQKVTQASLTIDNARVHRIPGEYGIGQRLWAHVSQDHMQLHLQTQVQVERRVAELASLPVTPMSQLPPEALTALRPSRFCPSDLFTDFVGQRFGGLEAGAKVAAISDWVRSETSYVIGSSDAGTTAIDTFVSRQGVCRDYAHLMCSLVRAANIPARYVSVYGQEVEPPDFHAAVQVWLDGDWHLVDPTGMCAPERLVIVAAGRDAADVAFMETSVLATVIEQRVEVTRS